MGIDAHGRAVMDWPDYKDDPLLKFAEAKLDLWTKELGARRSADLGNLPGMRHFGVHPLGGVGMGKTFYEGVVDDTGRVFAPRTGFYPGLRVVDASIMPAAIGVPPSLTIAAVAERAADAMLAGN
jgi:cholesterol oxidase